MSNKKPTYQELENQILELKKQQKLSFLERDKHHLGLFDNLPEMFQIIELIYNENGTVIDYYYKNVNPAFENFVSKSREQLIGKRAKHLFERIKDNWLQTYSEVVKTGESTNFENYDEEPNKYYENYVWRVGENQVAIIFNDISERKKLENNLNIANERLEDFFNLSPSLMMIKNPEGKVIKVNNSSKAILGYTEKEILNIDIWSLVHPDDLEKSIQAREEEKKSGSKISNFSNRYKNKNGIYRTLEWQASIVKNGFTYAIANDVTERNEVRKKLRIARKNKLKQSEDRLNMLLKASEDMITIHKPDGKYIYYNGPTCYPITPGDIVGKMPNEIFDQEASKTLLRAFNKVQKNGKSETIEVLLNWLGEKKWFSEYIFPVKNNHGKVVEIVKVCRDIHQRKIAEQELIIAKEAAEGNEINLKTLINTIPDLIWQKSVNGKFIFVNTRVEKLLGANEQDIIGKTDYDFVDKELADSFRKNDKKAMYNGCPTVNEEVVVFASDNHAELLETTKVPVLSENKDIIGVLGIGRNITEKRKAEQEIETQNLKLYELNNALNQAQKLSHVGSWQWDMKSDSAEWSDEMYNIYGENKDTFYPSNENVGKKTLPEDLQKVEQAISLLINNKIFIPFEFRIKRPCGEIRTLHIIALEKNSQNIVFGVTKDITEQRKIEENKLKNKLKLEKTERELNEAQKLAKVGSWLFDLTTQKSEWSYEMFIIWGFDAKKDPPEHNLVVDRIHKEDLALYHDSVNNAILKGNSFDIEYRILIGNGEQKTIRSICKPVLGDNGKVIVLSGTNQDITAQKRIEQNNFQAKLELEKIRNELNEAQKLAHVGSWLFDPLTQKQEWSEEIFNIWGFDSQKSIPEYEIVTRLIHSDDLKVFLNSIEKASTNGTPFDIEFRVCLPNAAQKTIRSICKPAIGDTGEVVNLVGTNQDITAQKKFKEEQIKHQRLKAIGEMSSSIAHDFNNSLQQMMGNLEIVKLQKDLPDETFRRLNDISSIIINVSERVSALQKFGDTKHNVNKTKLVDLNNLINESLSESRPLWKDSLEKEGLRIKVITDFKDIPKIKCNIGELKSAFYNLIKNSIEAMPNGGDLIIKTRNKNENVFVTFTDTGIGISEEAKLKVFQPFYSTKGFELGRGLGMSGVYSTTKKHGGNVVIKSSKLNKGTTIEMSFPKG